MGHHPIYAYTDKDECERTDMQERVNTVLLKHDNVDMYVCGHLHTFQHIRKDGSDIDYVVNSSGSLSRDVEAIGRGGHRWNCLLQPRVRLVPGDRFRRYPEPAYARQDG